MSRFFCFVCEASLAWFCSISFAGGVEPGPNKAGNPATTAPPQSSAKTGPGVAQPAAATKPAEPKQPAEPPWLGDYFQAWLKADREGKMLLVYFCKPSASPLGEKFDSGALADPDVRKTLEGMVRLRLPLDAKVAADGKDTRLIEHPAFAEMLGLPGLAIIDLAHKEAKYFGLVVSVFPFLDDHVYSADEMKVILDLPPGTLTQRTLIYASLKETLTVQAARPERADDRR